MLGSGLIRIGYQDEIALPVSTIYIHGDAMRKTPQAARLSAFVALLLAFIGILAAPANAAPTPLPGEYYGSENGNVVEFALVKSHGVVKGHYLGRALNNFPSSSHPSVRRCSKKPDTSSGMQHIFCSPFGTGGSQISTGPSGTKSSDSAARSAVGRKQAGNSSSR